MAKRTTRRKASGTRAATRDRPGRTRVVLRRYTAVIERDMDTGLFVGSVPGFPGAHSQGETVDELTTNLREVLEMLLEDGEPRLQGEFVGTQQLQVG